MPDNEQELRFLIELLAKNKGAIEAAAAIEKVGTTADQTKKKMGLMGQAAEGLSGKLAGLLGAAAIGALVKSSVEAFAKFERALNTVSFQLKGLGKDADKELPRIRKELEDMALGGGAAVEESLPAFQKFLNATEDVGSAMALTRLAADVAETGMLNVQAATQGLAAVLSGQASGAAVQFGVKVRGMNGELLGADEVLKSIADKFGGVGSEVSDTTTRLSQANAGWEAMKRAIGEAVAPKLVWLIDMVGAIPPLFKSIPPAVGVAVTGIAEGIARAGNVVAAFFKNLPALITGDTKGFKDAITVAWQEGLGGVEDAFTRQKNKLRDAWNSQGKTAAEAFQEGLDKAAEIAAAKDKAARDKEAETARKEAEKKAEDIRKLEEQAGDSLAQLRLAQTKEGSTARRDLELSILADQHARAVAEYKKQGADTAALDEAYELAREQVLKDYTAAVQANISEQAELEQADFDDRMKRLEEEKQKKLDAAMASMDAQAEILQSQLAADGLTLAAREKLEKELVRLDVKRRLAEAKTTEQRVAIIKSGAAAIDNIEKQSAQERIRRGYVVAQSAIDIAGAVFGNNKAIAIAQTIIDTAQGAQAAIALYSGSPVGWAVAAAIVAAGIARVQQIRKAEPEGGGTFDDPVNDHLAFLGGRKSVEDFIRLTNAGLREGVADAVDGRGPQGASSVQEDRSMHLHFHGTVVGGRRGIRELSRKIIRATRLDQGRYVSG